LLRYVSANCEPVSRLVSAINYRLDRTFSAASNCFQHITYYLSLRSRTRPPLPNPTHSLKTVTSYKNLYELLRWMGLIFCIRFSLVKQPVSADRRHDTATVSRNVNWCSRQDDSCVSEWAGECVCGWVGESEWMSWWVSCYRNSCYPVGCSPCGELS
jgi:hypothetical protein